MSRSWSLPDGVVPGRSESESDPDSGLRTTLLAVTALALLARVWALGWRVFHQDEGRVGAWILHYVEIDAWTYRPIIHGPFLPHVNGLLFPILGASDFTARLPVALVGGLLPLAAWLFRERLRRSEVVALALFLAANPVLLYYSRFMRNDVLLAAFMLFAVGFAVRALDADDPRLLLPAGLALGLGFTTKENALLYPVAWVGALLFVVDHRLLLAVAGGADWLAQLRGDAAAALRRGQAWAPFVVGGLLLWFVTVVAFYAPLPEFWRALADPLRLPAVVGAAVFGSWDAFAGTWTASGMHDHAYLPYLEFLAEALGYLSLPLSLAALAGFLVDRYAGGAPRGLVTFCFLWGVASLAGYPMVVDINAAWTAVHVVTPLAIPAAVGVGLVYRLGRSALASDDPVGATAAAVLLLAGAAATGAVAVDTAYLNLQSPETALFEENRMVQYAQPAGTMQPTLREVESIAAANGGTDVLFYGESLSSPGESWQGLGAPPPAWFERLPLPWYLTRFGAAVNGTTDQAAVCSDPPPVVVALKSGAHGDPSKVASDVEDCLAERGYRSVTYQQYQWNRPLVFFLDPESPGATRRTGSNETA
jgi:uncharacterized protein (TIGR03663 family)